MSTKRERIYEPETVRGNGARSSPFRADTDRDGLDDDVEVAQGLDPTVADGDQDGLSDGEEIAAGTNAFEMDSDGDGIVDGRDGTPTQFTDEQVFFLHTDHLGGAAVVTDLSKAVVRKMYYGIWGDIRSDVVPASAQASLSPREGFTGQSRDPGTELLYYGARFYDPESARFVQPDSVVQAPLNPQNLNRYAYVANDPLNMVDPTGNLFGGVFGGLGTAIGNVATTVGGWISAGIGAIGGFLSGAASTIAAGFSALGNIAAAAASRVDFHRAIFAALDAQAMAAIALERIRQLQRFSPVQQPAIGMPIAQVSQSDPRALTGGERAFLENLTGQDFGGVRVDEGFLGERFAAGQVRSDAEINVFSEFSRLSATEQLALLSHESAHVVQRIAGTLNNFGGFLSHLGARLTGRDLYAFPNNFSGSFSSLNFEQQAVVLENTARLMLGQTPADFRSGANLSAATVLRLYGEFRAGRP